MTTLEVGAYIRLLVKNYANGAAGLPDDDRRLATIAGLTLDKWKKVSPAVRDKFESRCGKLHSARALQVMEIITGKNFCFDDNSLKYKEPVIQVDINGSTQPKPKPKPESNAANWGDNTGDNFSETGQQGKSIFSDEQVSTACLGDPAYKPELISGETLPGGWQDEAEKLKIPENRIFKSWKKFKETSANPYSFKRWCAWLKNEKTDERAA